MKNLIALIDSNAVAGRGLQLFLEDGGYQVVLGSDGAEIMRRLPTSPAVSLVLAEQWNSGPNSGLVEALSVRDKTKSLVPIIVLASRFDSHDGLKASVANLTIIPTPTESTEILAAVNRLTSQMRLHQSPDGRVPSR
jgi:DNA-binding response OmpR family regulator